jgi:hypothetical protein
MNTKRWEGVYPAVTTKFKADFSLDMDAHGIGLRTGSFTKAVFE